MECILNQVDPQFETTQGLTNRLSILLCPDGFSFMVTHAVTRRLLKLASYSIKRTDVALDETAVWPVNGNSYIEKLKTMDWAPKLYRQIDIAVASCKITTVPFDFSNPENLLSIMSAAYTVNAGEEILTDAISDKGPVAAVLVPRYITEYCVTRFPDSVLKSSAAVFVKGVIQMHSQQFARQIFINILKGYFEITVIQGSRLLYLNAFRYSAPQDVLYYVIFVLEQLGFVPSEEKVSLMGDISETSTIYDQLKMYCGTLNFVEFPGSIDVGDAFAGIAMHNYFTLFNVPLCE